MVFVAVSAAPPLTPATTTRRAWPSGRAGGRVDRASIGRLLRSSLARARRARQSWASRRGGASTFPRSVQPSSYSSTAVVAAATLLARVDVFGFKQNTWPLT